MPDAFAVSLLVKLGSSVPDIIRNVASWSKV